jgi:transposase
LVRDLVSEEPDLAAIMGVCSKMKGYPPCHPAAPLRCAYRSGVCSSRRIARACEERLDFQAATTLNQTDFRTISECRRRHLDALPGTLVQVLALCRKAGLAEFCHETEKGGDIIMASKGSASGLTTISRVLCRQ